jgi:hypothetical protein
MTPESKQQWKDGIIIAVVYAIFLFLYVKCTT